MDHIEHFLQKKNIFPILLKKELCVKIILEKTTHTILPQHVDFSGKKVILKINPQEKIQILFHKKTILDAFSKTPTLSFYTEIQ